MGAANMAVVNKASLIITDVSTCAIVERGIKTAIFLGDQVFLRFIPVHSRHSMPINPRVFFDIDIDGQRRKDLVIV